VGHNGPTGPLDLTSSTPAAPDPNAPAPSDRLWLRSELMGTQVITRDTGRRLGVVGEVMVDIDRREVVALGLRDNPITRFLPGLPRWMPLERIRQVGDVILVDSADSLAEGFDPDRFSKVINCQVITESGAQLGRVLGFSFDVETGELTTLVIGALGVPLLGEGVLSTWEMPVGEIVSSGTDRIIVYEGAEEKLKQLGTGLLEKLGIGGSSWEQEERERYRGGAVPAENQLPAGQPSQLEQRRIQPAASRSFQPDEEFDYVELEERREREPLRQRRYLDDEEDNRFGRFRDGEDSRRAAPLRDDRYGGAQVRDEEPSPYSPRRGLRENGLDAPEREDRDRDRPPQDWRREPSERFADQPVEGWRGRRIAEDPDDGLDLEQPLPRDRSQPRPRLDQEAPQPASNRRPSLEAYPRGSSSGSADPERNSKLVDVDVEPLDDPW